MWDFIREATVGFLGALIPALFTWRSNFAKDLTDREGIYADHTKELWQHIDEQTATIKKQSKIIDELTKQVENLTAENKRLAAKINSLETQIAQTNHEIEGGKSNEQGTN